VPTQNHSGIHGDPWSRCDRCGFDYPLSALQMQNGLLLCNKDVDDPQIWQRDVEIADILSNSESELENATARKRSDPNNEFYESS
jgi:hypothetical protein